ncbi:MAG: hypothetical protein LBB85_05055 [Dysgonamonadaceae bacterium]|jgi:hypothetical protein|nr:hypothetical protein [Dysgonamonadaceae bacterium]
MSPQNYLSNELHANAYVFIEREKEWIIGDYVEEKIKMEDSTTIELNM